MARLTLHAPGSLRCLVGLGLTLWLAGACDGPGANGPALSPPPSADVAVTDAGGVDTWTDDGASPQDVTPDVGAEVAPADTDPSTDVASSQDTVEASHPLDDLLRLHHVQVKGSHNSYHLEPPIVFHPSHDYSHPPLAEQLDTYGARAFEIDVHRHGDEIRVYHILFLDEASTCDTFEACLQGMKGWSDAHPGHLPMMVWLEAKQESGGDPFDDLTVLDDVIRAVFPPERLLTPDDVQGDSPTLRAALEGEGWPTLGEVRDRAMFMVLNGGSGGDDYFLSDDSLAGRAMFMGADPDQFDAPWATVAKINDPTSPDVAAALAANILVASNGCAADDSDDDCWAELEAGLPMGTHMYKDDVLAPVEGKDYVLTFPDGNPARCNPITAPPECTPEALENLP